MMGDIGKYKVSDLVKETGLARTTINDWLQRYAQYLPFEIRGKRKLYTDNAIAVLNEIAGLRNSGQNSFEIETSLAARHPVSPEIAEERRAVGFNAEPDDDGEGFADADAVEFKTADSVPEGEYALIAKRQTDEIARLIGEQLRQLNNRLEVIEQSEKRARRGNICWATAFLAAIVLILAASVGFFRLYEARSREYLQAQQRKNDALLEVEKRDIALAARQQELGNLAVTLDRNSREYQQNVKKLEAELEYQRHEFSERLRRNETEQQTVLREKLAAEKLELLKKLYDYAAKDRERAALLSTQQDNRALLDEMDKLRRQLETDKTAAAAAKK